MRCTRLRALLGLCLGMGVMTACGPGADRLPGARINAEVSCLGGTSRPLTRAVVWAELRRNGFSVTSSTSPKDCGVFAKAWMPAWIISNTLDGAHDERQKTEGSIYCDLRKRPLWGPTPKKDVHAPPSSPIWHGRKATFVYQNLECSLYPTAKEHVSRFERAMDRIVKRSS
jgi:hypothetical protein